MNLDLLAAETAQTIVNTPENDNQKAIKNLYNMATKVLGVLQENGVYATVLFLYSRTKADEENAKRIRKNLWSLLSSCIDQKTEQNDNAKIALKFVTDEITNDLDKLLLVKQLWEQTLIYVRYGAKARG
jgi:CRISPR/Cas system CMR-associated protein Cmr5 small subunit